MDFSDLVDGVQRNAVKWTEKGERVNQAEEWWICDYANPQTLGRMVVGEVLLNGRKVRNTGMLICTDLRIW